MTDKHISVSYEPSAYDAKVAIYAVPPEAEYARVEGIQISNADSTNYKVDLFWVSNQDKTVSSGDYWGDGKVRQLYYNYGGEALNIIIKDGLVPKGAALSALRIPLYLQPKDFIFIRPATSGSDNAFKPTVSVTEVYPDGVSVPKDLDLTVVNAELLAATY